MKNKEIVDDNTFFTASTIVEEETNVQIETEEIMNPELYYL